MLVIHENQTLVTDVKAICGKAATDMLRSGNPGLAGVGFFRPFLSVSEIGGSSCFVTLFVVLEIGNKNPPCHVLHIKGGGRARGIVYEQMHLREGLMPDGINLSSALQFYLRLNGFHLLFFLWSLACP